MRPKTFLMLLAVVLILGIVIWLTTDPSPTPSTTRMGQTLFADLEPNRIANIRLQDGQQSVHLNKMEVWEVVDRYGYPADFHQISDMVKRLAAAKIGSSFAATTETLANLGLLDPLQGVSENSGLRLIFTDEGGITLLDVILGRAREAAVGTGGHYLLPADSNTGYMVDQNFQFIGRRPTDWLDRQILDVRPEAIETVVCYNPAIESVCYTLQRMEPETDPVWMEAPDGKKLRTARMDAVFRTLIALSLEDVRPDSPELQARVFARQPFLTYRLYDGTRYIITPGGPAPQQPDLNYIKIKAEWDSENDLDVTMVSKLDSGDTPENLETEDAAREAPLPQQAAEQAASIPVRLQNWVFLLPEWKYKNFVVDATEFVETDLD